MFRFLQTLFAAAVLPMAAIRAQAPVLSSGSLGDSLTISLLTMGQGEQVWELFGHDAIWIHDETAHTDSLYNWGIFDSSAPNFYLHFLHGRMLYRMAGEALDDALHQYRSQNRAVWVQSLNLTSAEKVALRDFIRWNEQPQNVQYLYNYFTDDCATRVRDAIDRAVGGAIHTQLAAQMTTTTYRSNALRLMQNYLPILLVTGVDIGLGRPTDHTLSAWEDSFLPVRFMIHVRDVTLDGGARRLVGRETVVFPGTRPPEPTEPPTLWPPLLGFGLFVAALIALAAIGATDSTLLQVACVVLIVTWSLVVGLVGTILTLLWVATDHVAAHANENVLLFNPVWLIVAIAIPFGIARKRIGRFAQGVACLAVGLAICAFLLHASTLSRQANWPLIALTLPPAVAIGWIATRRFQSPRLQSPEGRDT